ncbi:transcriptional regulator, XRE family with cupin sensor [Anaerovirgula multivorans]|uniref:Transcriptional regulator, XRE family with cupin sensor n=1 Tax=Anaerovirgula multivorans TaxID=312168 RepID=A0A239GW42_9FIRM|nr:XRE family transcriptional regulator [Anaerovirgula multivorans]SNS73446.1 transcriptional regulator, XRE family with cupin sensor [Anaerovirgula multivorans]
MQILSEIADKIKELRKEKGLTLKDLAEKTELSVSFLSQVENGSSSLAITSLKKIADAFAVPMTYFFYNIDVHNYHVKIQEQEPFKMEGSNSKFIRLSGDFSGRIMEAVIVSIPGGQKHGHRYSHPGEEFVYVLEGVLIVEIEGTEYLVKSGDSIHYPSTIVHQWSNPLNSPVKVLSVISPAIF